MLATLAVVDGAWIALAAQARQFLGDRRTQRRINRASAAVMAGAAAAIAAH
jgi:threonine/homoserine/homoserine lactone efflux protein